MPSGFSCENPRDQILKGNIMKTVSLLAAAALSCVLSFGMPGFAADNTLDNAAKSAVAAADRAVSNANDTVDNAVSSAGTAVDNAVDRARTAIEQAARDADAAITGAADTAGRTMDSASRSVDTATEQALERAAAGAAGTGTGIGTGYNDPANISGSDRFTPAVTPAENTVADRTGQIVAAIVGLAILAGLIYWAVSRRNEDAYMNPSRRDTKTGNPDTKIYS